MRSVHNNTKYEIQIVAQAEIISISLISARGWCGFIQPLIEFHHDRAILVRSIL